MDSAEYGEIPCQLYTHYISQLQGYNAHKMHTIHTLLQMLTIQTLLQMLTIQILLQMLTFQTLLQILII